MYKNQDSYLSSRTLMLVTRYDRPFSYKKWRGYSMLLMKAFENINVSKVHLDLFLTSFTLCLIF